MPVEVKYVFTLFTLLVSIGIYFINPKANIAGPNWFWKVGKKDPFRNMFCKEDGTFRKYTKLGIYLWFGIVLTIIWVLPE